MSQRHLPPKTAELPGCSMTSSITCLPQPEGSERCFAVSAACSSLAALRCKHTRLRELQHFISRSSTRRCIRFKRTKSGAGPFLGIFFFFPFGEEEIAFGLGFAFYWPTQFIESQHGRGWQGPLWVTQPNPCQSRVTQSRLHSTVSRWG